MNPIKLLVLSMLQGRDISGQQIRDKLMRQGHYLHSYAFYHLMADLRNAGLVEGWLVHKNVNGLPAHEKRWRLTNKVEGAI
jgi:DNA-binding PadR family transcriptional regulator